MTTEEETTTPLRVCCYGSSSSRTPERYIDPAYRLGRALALRGHTCVNGAGSSGCMDAMNRGADDAGGGIVGVIHEKFVRRDGDWFEGASSVFRLDDRDGGTGGGNGNKHEVVIARGNDLQERKRLLVEGADALVVLPWRTGYMGRGEAHASNHHWARFARAPSVSFSFNLVRTMSLMMMTHPHTHPAIRNLLLLHPPPPSPSPRVQLWEMACARHIGFHSIPIVCINVDGYYDPFRAMLSRAHDDMLLYKHPRDILHFEETPE